MTNNNIKDKKTTTFTLASRDTSAGFVTTTTTTTATMGTMISTNTSNIINRIHPPLPPAVIHKPSPNLKGIGGRIIIFNLDYGVEEGDLWQLLDSYGDVWDIHVKRVEGRSRGIAVVTFEKWRDADEFKRKNQGIPWLGRRMRIEWDRDLTEAQGSKAMPGEYPIEMNESERRSLLIGGIVEGGRREEDLALQETMIIEGMEMKKLRTWKMVEWKVESSRRVGRKEGGKPRLMVVTFGKKLQADFVYHRRKVGSRQKIWISRYRPRRMREKEKMLQGIRKRRWMMKKRGESWEGERREKDRGRERDREREGERERE